MANVFVDDPHALRACFLYEFLQGHTAANAHRNICRVIGKDNLQYDVVKFWFRRFKKGDFDLENKTRSRRTRTYVDVEVDDNIGQQLAEKHIAKGIDQSSTIDLTEIVAHKSLKSGVTLSCSPLFPNKSSETEDVKSDEKDAAIKRALARAPAPGPVKYEVNDCVSAEYLLHVPTSDPAKPATLAETSESCSGGFAMDIPSTNDAVAPTVDTGGALNAIFLMGGAMDSEQPTTSKEESKPTAADGVKRVHRPHYHVSLTGELFRGEVLASKRGIYPVIRYPLSDGEHCYAFEQVRITKRGQSVYRCTSCRKNGSTISIAVKNGCDFIGDPTLLPHVCTPIKNAQDKVTRMVYQSCQAIATEPQLAKAKPNQLWQSIAQFIDDNAPDDEEQRKLLLKQFYRGGYKSRRTTIARAAAKLHRATMGEEMEDEKDRERSAQITT
uniref:HTH_48 domain-containing protein n=1 Tax=Haemonchus contortus TaxID=6289 RepID=A0A7I4Y2Y5_HAECO